MLTFRDFALRLKQVYALVRLRPFSVSTVAGRTNERHRRAALTALAAVLARSLSIATALITVPLTLHYLGTERYGMWMTMSSLVVLLSFADLGIGTGILNSFILRIPRCYPVYETGYQVHLKKVENYLDTIENLIPIGRYGAFKYNNQDHSILMGILAADKITQGLDTDLWQINTDVEYQEEARIKDVLI